MKDVMLILHFIGLAMGVGTSIAFMFLGMAAGKMEKDDAFKFSINSFALIKMGHIGLTLLVITGLYLMTPYWSTLGEMPLMITKLVLVFVLAALIGIMSSKAKKAKAGDMEQMNRIRSLGPFTLLLGIAIIVMAVLQYH
ncbi:MAG: hypothetical protein JXR19_07875 [Bacteroidia bacterium]